MSIDIDCVDWESTGDETIRFWQRRLPNALRVNSVGHMVDLIEDRLRPDGQIRRLRVFGHGVAGAQALGLSRDMLRGDRLYNQITLGTGSEILYANILGRLHCRFARGGWVELHGCSVGAGAGGWNLLKALASLWQVNVAPGTATQDNSSGFEVQYRVAHPNGQVETRRGLPLGKW